MLKEGCRPTAGRHPSGLQENAIPGSVWRFGGLGGLGGSTAGCWQKPPLQCFLALERAKLAFWSIFAFARALERWCAYDRPLGGATGSGFRRAYPYIGVFVYARPAAARP